MLKTKDGYAKAIGTSYQGSPDYLLLSNGDSKAISSLSVNYANSAGNADTLDGAHLNGIFTAFDNDENNISATIGTITKKFEVKYSNHSYYSGFIKGNDQRDTNNAPSYYMNTFGDSSLCTEFSQQGQQFGDGTYVNLITSTPWHDSTGGRPVQLAMGNHIGIRSAANDSTWYPWKTIPTIEPDGVMEIGKFIDWHWNNEIYGSQDFSTRLQAQNTSSYPNTVYLPTQSGQLALLDQVELSQYHVVDMRNYDSGYWHPVTVKLPGRGYNKIKVSVELNIGDKPSWATHPDGFTCNMEIWAEAHGWGTTNAETICLNYTYSQCNSNPCGWKQLGYPSLGVLFLRGGARYKVWTDFDATFTPHDKTYTWTSEGGGYTQSTGGPYTSCPGLDFVKNRIYANLEGSAYYLEGGNIPSWGTLTAANGFTNVSSYNYGSRGAYGLCGKNTALYMQLDGYFYQNEGKYRVIDTSDFNWTNLPGKVMGGNEFNIVNSGYNNSLWFNYLPIDNRNSSATITQYRMGNGNKGLASVYAYRFIADGKGCMWKDARDYTPFYATFNGGWDPVLGIKTVGGDWSLGSYDSYGNHLIFAFTSDSDYNAGVNGTAQYYLTAGGEFKINTLRLAGAVTGNMGVGSTNPQIIFAEGSTTQQVAITYTDQDTYRVSKGLKVHSHDGSDDANVWFEVQGYNYSSGYIKNESSDAYVLLGGGGHKPLSEFQLGSGSVSKSLNIFGVSYNGSAAKTVTTSTFVSQLPEDANTVTDGTMFITSWASDRGFADTNAVNVPYKRKASYLWSYIDSKVSSKYLPLAGGTMNGNARIGHGSGNLYIGNSGNDGWVYTQDIASQLGADKWNIRTSGAAHFGDVHICSKSDETFDTSVIECFTEGCLCLNYHSPKGVSLCNGGGTVQIGSYTTDDTGNNRLFVNGSEFIQGVSNVRAHVFADGFKHRSHNSNDSVLLAGGGYSQGVPVRYWAIYVIYIGNSPTDVYYTKRSGNYDFITSKTWESEGMSIFDIDFPSGYNKNNTLIFGNGDHCTNSQWRTPVYVTITTSNSFGSASQIRVMISDDARLNPGFARIYFMCMG